MPQQNVSYHPKQLVEAGVIVRERRGRYSYYALVGGALDHVAELVARGRERAGGVNVLFVSLQTAVAR